MVTKALKKLEIHQKFRISLKFEFEFEN